MNEKQCPNCGGYKTSSVYHKPAEELEDLFGCLGLLTLGIAWVVWWIIQAVGKHTFVGYACATCGYKWK
jgi:hypothetical protein